MFHLICWIVFYMCFVVFCRLISYESVVASAVLFAVVCWGSRLRVADANRLNKLIRKVSDVVGEELDSLTAVSDRRMLSKVQAILQHVSHLLHNALVQQSSTCSQRLTAPECTTECTATGSHSCLWPSACTTPPSDDPTHLAFYKTKQTT